MWERSALITLAVSRGGFTGVAAEQKDKRYDGREERKREERAKKESKEVNQNEISSFRALLGTHRFELWLQVPEKKKKKNCI